MTLTQFSYNVRRYAPFAVLGFVLLIVILQTARIIMTRHPKVVAPAAPVFTPVFGKLPALVPSHRIDYPAEASFVIDNIEGRPVTPALGAKIFLVPQKQTRLGYLQKCFLMAKAFGFNTAVVKHRLEGDRTVVFEDAQKKLSIDIAYFTYEFKYKYETTPLLFDQATSADEVTAKEKAKEFLRLVGIDSTELASGTENIIYLHFNQVNQKLEVVSDRNSANVVEVDFFRPDIDGYPVVSPKYFNAQNYVVMVFNGDNYQIIKSEVKFFEKDEQNIGYYPLKTGDQAWTELTSGKGYIVAPGGKSYPLVIKQMFLAYYDPEVYQPYLQPVYIFLGENNFAAYVPAIQEDYIE